MQSEKDKIMELLTITEVKEGGEVIFTDRSIEILQELGQQYKETPLFKKSRQDKIKVKPWIPTVGQWVLCIFKPDGEGDGFVIGGI
jgi:hypothetical protein